MRYVVGLVDTPMGRAALRWAVRAASTTGAAVEVVTAFRVPITWTPENGPRPTDDPGVFRSEARSTQSRAVRDAVGFDHLEVEVSREVRNGDAAEVLIEQSRGADLLVMGAPTAGGLLGRLQRSTARRVARRAHCPVVFVKPGDERRLRQRSAPTAPSRPSVLSGYGIRTAA